MASQEILLIIALLALVLLIILLPILIARYVKQPHYTYSNIVIGVLVLILVWGFAGDGSLPLKFVVTVLVIKNTVMNIKQYDKFTNEQKAESH